MERVTPWTPDATACGTSFVIEAHASSAQRGPLARLREDYDDDDDYERPETVGDAIEGAATTTTDSARQVAALVSNQPSHLTNRNTSDGLSHCEAEKSEESFDLCVKKKELTFGIKVLLS